MSLGGTVKKRGRGGLARRGPWACASFKVLVIKSRHHLPKNSWPMGTHWTNFYVSSENAWASPPPLLSFSPHHAQVGLTSGGNFIPVAPSVPASHPLRLVLVCLPSRRGVKHGLPQLWFDEVNIPCWIFVFISTLCLWAFGVFSDWWVVTDNLLLTEEGNISMFSTVQRSD